MNIVNKLTLRQLMLNRKRTLVTIIGVIISVAMITAVASLGFSFIDLLQRQSIGFDGEWHVSYSNININQYETIKKDKDTKTPVMSKDLGFALLENSQNKMKPYLYIREYSTKGFEKFPIQLVEGRLPEKRDEVVITEAILTNAKVNYQVGDTLTIDIGERHSLLEGEDMVLDQNTPYLMEDGVINEELVSNQTKTYSIVGIIKTPTWEQTWSPSYTVLSYIDEESLAEGETFKAYVVLNKVKSGLFDHANALAKNNGITAVGFNTSLLRFYGVTEDKTIQKFMWTICSIIMGIIVAGSVLLIYNAFAISVSERSRYLGMLSSVGATKKQKRNSVFFEGLIIGGISIPIGLVSGLGGIGITISLISPLLVDAISANERLKLVISPASILIAVAVSMGTIFISTFVPARKASKVTAIDAIRQTSDIRLKGRAVKTSKLTRKVFGIEGDLGLKNLKRNKSRYKTTVLSLIVSIVLFMVVNFFTTSLKKSMILTQDGLNFDIQVGVDTDDPKSQEELYGAIKGLDLVDSVSYVDRFEANTWISKDKAPSFVKDRYEMTDGQYLYAPVITAMDDESLKIYAQEVGIDFEALKDPDKITGIVIDTVQFADFQEGKYVEAKALKTKVGEQLELEYYDEKANGQLPLGALEIVALTNKMPMGTLSMGPAAGFYIIVSKDTYNRLLGDHEALRARDSQEIYFTSKDAIALQVDLEALRDFNGYDINIFNIYLYNQRDERMVFIMNIFIYAFIILITAICVANIMNTISTSIALRKREFAMLKSVGMTPKGFNRMINFESIFYGLKALVYGLPISFALMYLMYKKIMDEFSFGFPMPWASLITVIVMVFVIVGLAMAYSISKVKKENIVETMKQEII